MTAMVVPGHSIGIILVAAHCDAEVEFYLAGQGGVNVPQDLHNIRGTGPLSGVTSSELNLRNQIAYGIKAGYYFLISGSGSASKRSFITATRISSGSASPQTGRSWGGTISCTGLAVNTWALNALVRYPGRRFQPYAGIGAVLNYALLRTAPRETTFFAGLNAVADIRVFVSRRVALFTEYKYNQATIDFSDQNIKADYRTNYFMGGLSYHFN